jgi:hypothetical protein
MTPVTSPRAAYIAKLEADREALRHDARALFEALGDLVEALEYVDIGGLIGHVDDYHDALRDAREALALRRKEASDA